MLLFQHIENWLIGILLISARTAYASVSGDFSQDVSLFDAPESENPLGIESETDSESYIDSDDDSQVVFEPVIFDYENAKPVKPPSFININAKSAEYKQTIAKIHDSLACLHMSMKKLESGFATITEFAKLLSTELNQTKKRITKISNLIVSIEDGEQL